jgi:hypothetical protein
MEYIGIALIVFMIIFSEQIADLLEAITDRLKK